jgi:hypothetical protein
VTSIVLRRPSPDLGVKLKFASGLPAPAGATGPVGEGEGGLFFESRAAAVSATIGASITAIRTAGYSTVGDRGHGLYRKKSVIEAAEPAGGFTSVDGARWALVVQGGAIYIEQFGGKADWNGSTGTDNYAPMVDAIKMATFAPYSPDPTLRYGPTIKFGLGKYYFSQMLEINRIVYIKGVGTGTDTQGTGFNTQWHVPADTTGILIARADTLGETGTQGAGTTGGATRLEGFSLHLSGTDTTKSGVHARDVPILVDIGVYGSPGTGFKIHGTAGGVGAERGSVNRWIMDRCYVHTFGMHGLWVWGSDGNAGICNGFETHGTRDQCNGCGILDESGLGNQYFGLQITGYGNEGVSHGGNLYFLISNVAGIGSSTTPGTDNSVWYFRGVGAPETAFPAWSALNTYIPQMAIACFGSSNRSTFGGIYVEGATIYSHLQGPAVAFGGDVSFTNLSAHFASNTDSGPIISHTGVGGYWSFVAGDAAYTRNGDYTFAYVGSAAGEQNSMNVFHHGRQSDGGNYWRYGYRGNDLVYSALNQKYIWEVTTPATAKTFGRSATVPNMFCVHDFALMNQDNEANSRIMGMRDAAPSSGYHARGEVMWAASPSAGGFAGWVCTTSGTPGTWLKFGAIQGTSAYTTTNVSTDRSYDANATTTDELADVLGTLIADLKVAGILT